MYEKLHVRFLLDESDTIAAYEERGKLKTAAAASSYQQGIDAFVSSLGRIQQIEMLQGQLHTLTCIPMSLYSSYIKYADIVYDYDNAIML